MQKHRVIKNGYVLQTMKICGRCVCVSSAQLTGATSHAAARLQNNTTPVGRKRHMHSLTKHHCKVIQTSTNWKAVAGHSQNQKQLHETSATSVHGSLFWC